MKVTFINLPLESCGFNGADDNDWKVNERIITNE